ncbi:MAG TPA: TonB-dependent receptor [Rhizomicrobium sp.]|nr:TonB-dependent receptor [Rhizomicrobium sp.]
MRLLLWMLFLVVVAPIQALPDESSGAETIVVTAARAPEPREITGSALSILTARDLADQQIVVLSDALAELPGVQIVRNGGVGQPTSILLRGAEAGQTLLLVDGVRINDPTAVDESAIMGDVLVNNIDRIEVLRGPQSTLYGSDAIGGVVNILTRRGGESPFSFSGEGEGGSFDTYRFNAGANGSADNVDYGASLNFYHTNGISAADSRFGNTETDGYTNGGATANVRIRVDENVSVDLRTYDILARDNFDDNFVSISVPPYFRVADSLAYGNDELLANYAGLNFGFGELQNRLAVTDLISKRVTFPAPAAPDDFTARGNVERLEYQGIFAPFPDNEVIFGAEYQNSHTNTHSIYDLSPRPTIGNDGIAGYYGQWQSTLWRILTLTGGLRYDRDDEFGGHLSGKLAGALALDGGDTVLRANYGNGFKAPSLYELYSEYSNPLVALEPEVAQGYEAGVDQFFWSRSVRAAITVFERDTQNQIDFFDCFGPTSPACDQRYLVGGYYYNIGRSRARGIESEVTLSLSKTLTGGLSYTDLTTIDLATGDDLARVPHITADAHLTWNPTDRLSLGGSIGYVGRRFDDSANTVGLSSNTLVNLYASYGLTDTLQLFARVENAFDIHYEPVYGYGAAGRAVYGGLRVTY